ncbi:helix-turn-helix domain-containing protein [Comamonas koreensis]|uniref:Helix-turn-helix domain-containing protein n=1 Tax=Comamonas koreensis TaxID=160825 RepID=A0AAW4XTV3_9BURK|nr:helix-turn-helix transcriptional regulator [Comamonas koreensis]MCD2165053.1 helix-turn-helix domain-containing protein [Comamonas koreensis]
MLSTPSSTATVLGRRMRARREDLGWSQEKVGVLIGIDESASRARISRYELGTHEPPIKTARLIAEVLQVPLAYLYCEDDDSARLLLALGTMSKTKRAKALALWLAEIA